MRQIARELGRPASTITREVARNTGRSGYRAAQAERSAARRRERPKPCKLAGNRRLRMLVAAKLRLCWSPEQIAGWLRRTFPSDASKHVSHETIYRTLFVQARGVLKRELSAYLRSHRMKRGRRNAPRRGRTPDTVSIRERPAEVADRAVPGHWEGDLIQGANQSFIATLAERNTRYVSLVKVPSRETKPVVDALIRAVKRLPTGLFKSLTWDNGKEVADHKRFTIATDVQLYFCDPHSPWQRGTNENTNGLLRQYLPNTVDFTQLSQRQLDRIARELNMRPRETLDFASPAEKLEELLR
jgi:IS30 family transposase